MAVKRWGMVVDTKLWGEIAAELARERAAGDAFLVGAEPDPTHNQIARVLNALGALGYFVGKAVVEPMVTTTPETPALSVGTVGVAASQVCPPFSLQPGETVVFEGVTALASGPLPGPNPFEQFEVNGVLPRLAPGSSSAPPGSTP